MSEEVKKHLLTLDISIDMMRVMLEPGEARRLAKKHGMKPLQAYRLLKGQRKITDADWGFVLACYDKVRPRKPKFDKLKTLAI